MLTEFTAVIDMARMAPGMLSERTRVIMTYALCGFANIASVGINVADKSVRSLMNGETMKLYDSRLAPNPRRVRWFMAEKGIDDIEIEDVDLLAGAHKTPSYLGRVGVANVPALTLDDGTTITESVAICRYLEALHPAPNMFGEGAKETAVIEMWTRRAEMMAATPLMMAVRHGHPALAVLETQVPEVAATNRAGAERALKLFDRRLAESPWIAADGITLADGILFIGIEFARMVRFRVPEEMTHLFRWHAAMKARPSAAAGT